MPSKSDAPSRIWTKLTLSIQQILSIVEADMHKIRHDPYELIWRMVQPVIWLVIFGEAMANARTIPTNAASYLDFIAPGIMAQSILFLAIFYGIALIWERDVGILHKILVTPTPRVLLVIGRSIAAGMRALPQVFVVYIVTFFLGVDLHWNILSISGVLLMAVLGAALFSTFSLIVAAIVKKRERFMGIGQLITMPLFFASNALYPIDIMPGWIRTFSLVNPLTYQVDALRSLMIIGQYSHFGLLFDFGVCICVYCLLVGIATYIYPKILY
jgi:ABC-2 type transport system permease protein